MPTKEERQTEAKKHNGLVRGVFASDIAAAIESAVIYEDGEGRDLAVPEPRFEQIRLRPEPVRLWSEQFLPFLEPSQPRSLPPGHYCWQIRQLAELPVRHFWP